MGGQDQQLSEKIQESPVRVLVRRCLKTPTKLGLLWFYELVYEDENESYVLIRRYSQFLSLHKEICQDIPEIQDLSFPGKSYFTSNYELAESRRQSFQTYLSKLLTIPSVSESEPLRNFLGKSYGIYKRKPLREGFLKMAVGDSWTEKWLQIYPGKISIFDDDKTYYPACESILGRCILSFTKAGHKRVFLDIVTDSGVSCRLTSDDTKDLELWASFVKRQAELVQRAMKSPQVNEAALAQPVPALPVSIIPGQAPSMENNDIAGVLDASNARQGSGSNLDGQPIIDTTPIIADASVERVNEDIAAQEAEAASRETQIKNDLEMIRMKNESASTELKRIGELLCTTISTISTLVMGVATKKFSSGKWTQKYLWLSDSGVSLNWSNGQVKKNADGSIGVLDFVVLQAGVPTQEHGCSKTVRGNSLTKPVPLYLMPIEVVEDIRQKTLALTTHHRYYVFQFESTLRRDEWLALLSEIFPKQGHHILLNEL